MNKLILTDCDGVILNWFPTFLERMSLEKNMPYTNTINSYHHVERCFGITKEQVYDLIKEFNTSDHMKTLPPLPKAISGMTKLHDELGYTFGLISSFSFHENSHADRDENLHKHLHPDMFAFKNYLHDNSSKVEALTPYKDSGTIWVEDHIGHANDGQALGLTSVLIAHDYTSEDRKHLHEEVIIVDSWEEIYHMVANNQL